MNCNNIPTITVCHTIAFLFLEVTHKTRIMTAKPNRDTARFARVLSALSGVTKPPMMSMTTTEQAATRVLKRSGMSATKRTAVVLQAVLIGVDTIVMGTWKKTRRRVIQSQRRKALSHPVLDLNGSLAWRASPATHQLLVCQSFTLAVSCKRNSRCKEEPQNHMKEYPVSSINIRRRMCSRVFLALNRA